MKRFDLHHLVLALLLVVASCAMSRQTPTDKNTNWLQPCESDSDCGQGSCICSICTASCDTDTSCEALSGEAICFEPKNDVLSDFYESCETEKVKGICLPECNAEEECPEGLQCVADVCIPEDIEVDDSMPVDGAVADSDDAFVALCGNGIMEGDEACDDGNFDDEDGCTRFCAYTCNHDDDCDDGNPCNGKEICIDDHICSTAIEWLPDGAPCGDNDSCFNGVCLRDVADLDNAFVARCGNGILEGIEACDDGNLDDEDGCTRLCEYTCIHDHDCDDGDPCNGTEICVDDYHMCSTDTEWLRNGDSCGDNASCFKGVCVERVCGNGIVEGYEECDDGNLDETDGCTTECTDNCEEKPDGTPCGDDASCSWGHCFENFCGDGIVQGDEACDDGNDDNTDSCTTRCVVNCEAVENGTPCGENALCTMGLCAGHVCGNGILEGDEACDDGNLDETDGCTTECTDNCEEKPDGTPCGNDASCFLGICLDNVCGDGIVQGDEACDDGNLDYTDGCTPRCIVTR